MSYDIVIEDVPPYHRRVGDYVIQGSNNSTVVLGTDRPGPLVSGEGGRGSKRAGALYAVVGRSGQDPDLLDDMSYVYLSMRSDIDGYLGLKRVERPSPTGAPSATLKSDGVRIVARRDVKIVIDGTDSYVWMRGDEIVLRTGAGTVSLRGDRVVIDAGRVELGAGAHERVVLGDSFKLYFMTHTHPTSSGTPTGVPIQPWVDVQLLSSRTVYAG